MTRIGIIQISDTQFGPKHFFNNDSGSSELVRKLSMDVEGAAEKHAFVPVYLVCSGDIAEFGKKEQFDEGAKVLSGICDANSIDRNNVLLCPGNHDVNWTLSKASEDVGEPRLKLSVYDKFCERFYGNSRNRDDDEFEVVVDSRYGICFVMMNSCEIEDHETHVGHVSQEKLLRTLKSKKFVEACKQGFLNIAIVHHRLDVAASEERSSIDNADEIVAILHSYKFQVALTGHVHSEFTHATKVDGHTIVYSGCGSTGVDKTQRADGVPLQYSIHVIDDQQPRPQLESYFRAYNPNRRTRFGLGGWTEDSTYDELPIVHNLSWAPEKQVAVNEIIEDMRLNEVLGIRKNPFTVSNAEKFDDRLILKLFVHDEERHRSALRLTGDAIIRGKRGSGKTMCLKYLNAIGFNKFTEAIVERQSAECMPVLVNLGQLHLSERDADIAEIYESAESLIVEQTIAALDRAVYLTSSLEIKNAVYRAKQRYSVLKNQQGSKIAHLGSAITENLRQYFDHVLLLIDEIAPIFPKSFFKDPENGFGKWMNAIRNSGPYNTRIVVYPNDVSDTLNEERFGSVVNLEFDPTKPEDLSAFRKYAKDLFERYTSEVASDRVNSPKLSDLMDDSGGADAVEQLLYATDGSSRRLMKLFDTSLTYRCSIGVDGPMSKDDLWKLVAEYSENLLSGYGQTEQQLAISIAKACKRAATFRFKCPGLTDSIRRLSLGREETNVVSIVEVGSGTRATSYEFHYPFCIQMDIPTHHVKETSRICKGRDIEEGEWIQKITNLNRENLDFFKDKERKSGKVLDFIGEGAAVILDDEGEEYLAESLTIDLEIGNTVSFIAVDGLADDLLVV